MAQLLNKLNRKQRDEAFSYTNGEDIYARYKMLLKLKEKFELTFNGSDTKGNLITVDKSGIRIVLPLKKLEVSDLFVSRSRIPSYLGVRKLEVEVDYIKEEENTVYLKSGRATPAIVKAVKRELFEEVDKYRDSKAEGKDAEPYSVYGVITKVDAERQNAYVNILGQPIIGICRIKNWSKAYVRAFPEGIENTGEPRKFDLVGTYKKDGKRYFSLEAENYNENPWDNVPKELLEVDAVWIIKCIEIPLNKHFWWGKAENIDIEIMCNFNDNLKEPIRVGSEYACTIRKADAETTTCMARPIRLLRPAVLSTTEETDTVVITKEDLKNLEKEKRAKKKEQEESEKKVVEIPTETQTEEAEPSLPVEEIKTDETTDTPSQETTETTETEEPPKKRGRKKAVKADS